MTNLDDVGRALRSTIGTPPSIEHLRRVSTRRRRRKVRSVIGTMVAALIAITVGISAAHGGSSTRLVSTAPGPSLPASCQGGGPPSIGQGRIGVSVAFRYLPAGYQPQPPSVGNLPGQDQPNLGQTASSRTQPADQLSITAHVNVDLVTYSALKVGTATIDGHPALIERNSNADPPQLTAAWSPATGTVLTLQGTGVTQAELLRTADGIAFHPGVTAPYVGDQGAVVPRSTVVDAARRYAESYAGPQDPIVDVRTWLVTAPQWQAVLFATSPAIHLRLAYRGPLWVVAITLRYSTAILSNGAPGSYVLSYNASNGSLISNTGSQTTTGPLAPVYRNLQDHSGRPPCPRSS